MYPAVLLMYFISAAVIPLASLGLLVQVSLPYNHWQVSRTIQCNVKYSKVVLMISLHVSVNPRHPEGEESIHSGFCTFQDGQVVPMWMSKGLPATCRYNF